MELKPENDFNAGRRDHGLAYWARDTAGHLHLVGSRNPPTPGPIPPHLLDDPANPFRNWRPGERA